MDKHEDHERRIRGLGGELEYESAQSSVLLCAISALIETHPEPAAFARAFRAQWHRIGSQNQAQPGGSKSSEGMDDALGFLEASCPVALEVRPPDVAEPPGVR
jgi:hypothetical protein